jgi:F-type H+-transporting ATPase subunit a
MTNPLQTPIWFHLGPIPLSSPVVTTWILMALLAISSWLVTRRLRVEPSRSQLALEIVVEALLDQIRQVIPNGPERFLPLLGTLFIYLTVANLSSLLPGVSPPTAHLETAGALALVVYLSTHYYGVRIQGLGTYLKGYLRPNPLLLPLNILAELTRSFSLAVRLFGNIMSHELVIGIVLALAGLLVPIPLMVLGALIGIVQAYIFSILATVFIGGAVGSFEKG